MAMTFVVFVVYGLVAHAFRSHVIESPRVQRWLRYSFAAAFAGLGARLVECAESSKLGVIRGRRDGDAEGEETEREERVW